MLSILPYHRLATEYFQKQDSVWQFFANHSHKADQLRDFKLELLKNTYKFDESADASLFEKVSIAKQKLNLSFPVYVYQAQNNEEVNATIVYVNEEAHIVFSGKLIQSLNDEELLAVIAHELSHIQLYVQINGAVEVTDRIIRAIGNHPGSTPAHYETARLFNLYTEIFCDRGAYAVTGSYAPIITSLVKIATSLQTVNADSFIKQAEEIFTTDDKTKTQGLTHPENFIRARAIWLWHSKGLEAEVPIQQMIEGYTGLDELDLFKQEKITGITKELILLILEQKWMQTPQTIALANSYFPGINITASVDRSKLLQIQVLHPNLKDYFSYLLYDFATADKHLEDLPLGYSFFLSDELKMSESFLAVVKKERKLTDKKTSLIKKQALAEYQTSAMQPA